MSCTSIKYGLTRRALDLLGHLITKVFDHQLENRAGEGKREGGRGKREGGQEGGLH